ncbi:mRNA turnover protein 4 homolog [Papaver somniferum]|uniref:mRNA turnover protein 4 homolog n=1 Tax=Papaver somniferum TaxID=3469 RepID=UPI000E6FB884|nr:mRNA turnover protein 4 homolog [Papaver somniferum]
MSDKELEEFRESEFQKAQAEEERKRKERIANRKNKRKDEMSEDRFLEEKGMREAQKREAIENSAIRKYSKENPFDEKSFKSDIINLKRGGSIYVFCFGYAKIQTTKYKNFIMSSLTKDNFSKVYIGGFNRELSKAVGFTREKELRPGLHEVGVVLDSDDVGVILTDKTEAELLTKLREYEELDFSKPGNMPMKTLNFDKDQVLPLPTRTSARKLFPLLRDLKMPVKLINNAGQTSIKLTENFIVCEERVRVTENASKILKHLKQKMFNYVIVPVCRWTDS